MAQMPVVEEGAEPPPYFPRTLVTLRVGMPPGTPRVPSGLITQQDQSSRPFQITQDSQQASAREVGAGLLRR